MLQTSKVYSERQRRGAPGPLYNLKPKPPHFAPKAKNVIFIYIGGGPSTIDMFDPKPGAFEVRREAGAVRDQRARAERLAADHGQPMAVQQMRRRAGARCPNLLPYFQKVVDKVAFVRSMTTDRIDHSTAQFTFVTGRGITGFPSHRFLGELRAGHREPESAGLHRAR